ncbi:hypothetical protein PR048_015184 [Dryococelus australis]|uniref:HTH CENPB-type domain-containing protein n=1 Tax=Dryococelus australis TaxID=614101 RepID=A0ABQ9HGR2_9NEOP|nr:hypothetical protein PR048_015184 [Dryococelus australis]
MHPFHDEHAGRAWLDHFLRRHMERLSLRKPTSTSYVRAEGFSQEQVSSFFDLLEELHTKHNLTAERVWNVNKAGIGIVQSNVFNVIGSKGKRHIRALGAAEHGSLVTIICPMRVLLMVQKEELTLQDGFRETWSPNDFNTSLTERNPQRSLQSS